MLLKEKVIVWLVKGMLTWIPTHEHFGESATSVQERYNALASDYYDVATSEPPLFKEDEDRLKTMTLLASMERFESSFAKGPIHGDKHRGKVHSFCAMQIQPGPTGIVLTEEEWHYADRSKGEQGFLGVDLDANHTQCLRVGLHMLRSSFRHTGDLGEYTGEGKGGSKANVRLQFATSWYKRHFKDLEP